MSQLVRASARAVAKDTGTVLTSELAALGRGIHCHSRPRRTGQKNRPGVDGSKSVGSTLNHRHALSGAGIQRTGPRATFAGGAPEATRAPLGLDGPGPHHVRNPLRYGDGPNLLSNLWPKPREVSLSLGQGETVPMVRERCCGAAERFGTRILAAPEAAGWSRKFES